MANDKIANPRFKLCRHDSQEIAHRIVNVPGFLEVLLVLDVERRMTKEDIIKRADISHRTCETCVGQLSLCGLLSLGTDITITDKGRYVISRLRPNPILSTQSQILLRMAGPGYCLDGYVFNRGDAYSD